MGIFDNLKKTLTDATESAKSGVKNLQESAKNINLNESFQELTKKGGEALQNIQESAKNININESIQDITKKSGEAFDNMVKSGGELIDNAMQAMKKPEEPNDFITSEDALKILYYLMSIDGAVAAEEMDKFDAIGTDTDPEFDSKKETILEECRGKIAKAFDEEDVYDTIHDAVSECIKHSQSTSEGSIRPQLLLWNLTVVAFSEGEYSELEKRLIRYITKQLGFDNSMILEMESDIRTLLAIEKEEQWLKSSNRQYMEIEVHMNELADRKNTIMQGVQALMLD